MDITKNVKSLRKQLGLNQQQFADMIGVSQSTVSKWEKGAQRPDLDSVVKMQEAGGDGLSVFARSSSHRYDRSSWGVDVKVVGSIHEDHWNSSYQWDTANNFYLKAPKRKSWENLDLLGFLVEDDSASPVYPQESVLVCAKLNVKVWHGPKTGDHLIISEHQEGSDLVRVVVRQLALGRQGEILLSPFNSVRHEDRRSFTLASRMDLLAAGGYEAFGMIGIILGGFIVENPNRFPD